MSILLGDNFQYQAAKPLDARLKYDTTAAMKAVADATMYEGCLAYCTATDKTYQWKSGNTVDTTLGKWREFSGSGGGASTLNGLTDVDLSNPSNGQILKYNSTTQKWENAAESGGGGGGGSIFVIETSLTSLFGTTVTVTDSNNNTFTGTFNNLGLCEIQGITSVGDLRISFVDMISPITQTVLYYSKYTIIANYVELENVNWSTVYAPISSAISKGINRLAGTVWHQRARSGSAYNTWYSNSSDLLNQAWNTMTSKYETGTYHLFNNTLDMINDNSNRSTTVKFLVPGYAIFTPNGNPLDGIKNTNVFSVAHHDANETMSLDPSSSDDATVIFFPDT